MTHDVTGEATGDPVMDVDHGGPGDFRRMCGQECAVSDPCLAARRVAGPTPYQLIHSVTTVACGIYLVGRFVSVFTGDVLV